MVLVWFEQNAAPVFRGGFLLVRAGIVPLGRTLGRMKAAAAVALLGGLLAVSVRAEAPGVAIARAAAEQIGRTLHYDPAYVRLEYPGGDVPLERGVCTDVVVRALRAAAGVDLQQRVHEDMRRHFTLYPQLWGLKGPDRNIDHRRVPNLRRYFERQGWALPVGRSPDDFQPGDLVACTVPPGLPHIMVVAERRPPGGVPRVIHNIGQGVKEEDRLFEFPLNGHYRAR